MTRQVIGPIALSVLFCSFLYALVIPVVVADELVAFDPGLDEFPESVSADVSGNVYVSLRGGTGEIRRIKPNGEMVTHFQLDPAPSPNSFGILGVLTDGPGKLFAAVASLDPATHGVWLIKHNGKASRIEGSQVIAVPDDLTLDDDGHLYVTDLLLGEVWRISRDEKKAFSVELWASGPLLIGNGSSGQPTPIGANGIAYHDGTIFVSVTEQAHIVSYHILDDGSAGPGEIYAADFGLFTIDGITVDSEGTLYGAVVAFGGAAPGAVMRIEQGKVPVEIFGPADGLQFPTSVTFGSHPTDCNFLYIVNWDVVAPLLGLEPKPALHGFSVAYSGDAITCNP